MAHAMRLDLFDQRLALAGTAAQHGVDEAGIFGGAPVRLHQPHRKVDGGMIGHVHPENLRRADQQRALRPRRVRRDAAVEQARQQMAERAEPPQNRRHQAAHQGAVAVGERFQSGMGAGAVELIVEGAVLVQHSVEDVGRDPPCGEAGHFRRYCESRRGHEAGMSRGAERFRLMPIENEPIVWHANMPNVRIATDNFANVMSSVRLSRAMGELR
jgi:hypothetical protein